MLTEGTDMNIAKFAIVLSLFLSAQMAQAQEPTGNEPALKSIISDLNVIAEPLSNEVLSNGDVAVITGATCSTMQVVRRNGIDKRVESLVKESYPSEKEIASLDRAEYIKFEERQLKKYGATEKAVQLVNSKYDEYKSFPNTAPSSSGSLIEKTAVLEEISCGVKEQNVTASAETAPPEKAELAKKLGLAVIGTAAIAVDAEAGLATGGTAGAVISGVSMGWGWNRIEDAFSYVKKVWSLWM